MLFNSYEFLFFFLPVTFALYRVACAKRATQAALGVLLLSSLGFYSYWNPPFILLLLFSIAFNFLFGRIIEREYLTTVAGGGGNKPKLIIGIAVNLLLIIYFKYSNFLISNAAWLVGHAFEPKDIFLPLGISFFTFQQIAYLIDCSKGKAKGHSFLQYALFVSFFPQLIAGPIVRYEDIIPQFSKLRTFGLSWRNLCMALSLLSFGLFKKVVIADTLSPWVAMAFDSQNTLTLLEAWGGALCYALQIYFDFSGYSDMAIGLGLFFGVNIPINFNSPYKALSIIDFWRRWHITLSTFLRDYLYIPLGGNRKGRFNRYRNLMITMLLGGLWHGAAWNFVIWGGLHGLYLTINHLWRDAKLPKLPKLIGWVLTFGAVCVAWVFFRAESFGRAVNIIEGMAGLNGFVVLDRLLPGALLRLAENIGLPIVKLGFYEWNFEGKKAYALIVTLIAMAVAMPSSLEFVKSSRYLNKRPLLTAAVIPIVTAIALCSLSNISEFLYFQF